MLDKDLAELYGVPVKVLNQSVKRNIERFPEDFMFQLNAMELERLRSQFVTLKRGEHRKYLPYVFTENGVAMLSSVLNSRRAIQVNIQIMRTFTDLRKLLLTHKDLKQKIETLERKFSSRLGQHDRAIQSVFNVLTQLLEERHLKPNKKIGFLR